MDRLKLALQGYNYGSGYIDWAMARDGGYTKENAIAYSDMMCARPGWNYSVYGDKEYTAGSFHPKREANGCAFFTGYVSYW